MSYYPPPYPHAQAHYGAYCTPPMSPQPQHNYSTRFSAQHTPSPRATPSKGSHHRRASHAVPSQAMPPQYSSRGPAPPYMPAYDTRTYESSQRKSDYVSGGFDSSYNVRYSRPRRDTDAPPLMRSHRERKRRPSQPQHVHSKFVYDDPGYGYGYGYDNDYHYEYSPPPPYSRHETYRSADRFYYDQVPIYTNPTPKSSSRQRRASNATKPQGPMPRRPSTSAKATPRATEEDARRAGIPAGYSYKNWDPTEEPIMLLGSVFDANSLGKWIYDWTVFHYGPATPLAEMAGELWLLLIQLAGKVKRAEETMNKIRKQESREMVEDFLESGERLWIRFAKLLKVCEDYMWKVAKKESGAQKPVSMGKNSGCEFVDSIFGRDRELEKTEKLMTGMRLWSMRFDANCEDILRYPSA